MIDRRLLAFAGGSRRGARLACCLAAAIAILATACGRDIADPAAGDVPIRFQVSNALIAPVTVSVDGTPYAILTSGKATSITVPGSAQWLTWTSAKPAGPDGAPIPDQIGEVKVSISGINGALEIANVIDDQTYITARVFNATNAQVAIGVTDGSNLYCAGVVPAGSTDGAKGFVQIGYYRLLPSTEVRAYRDALRCTGPYVAWPSSQLAAFMAKSGLLTLLLESAP
jgi:hypothetical protein